MELIIGGAFQNKREYVIGIHGASLQTDDKLEINLEDKLKDKSEDKLEIKIENVKFMDFEIEKITVINSKSKDSRTIRIVNHVQDIIKAMLLKDEYRKEMFEELITKYPDIIFLCDEVGSGIVPIDRVDRDYRDKVGELCCHLAKKPSKVHRVVCGIGMVIKNG